jgi:cell fate (sporulation/competence/biofilm development) regulator YlbF (YheA/YmcA/DUF963 family)
VQEALLLAEDVAKAINKSEIYGNYLKARKKIKEDKDLYNRIVEFKRCNLDYQKKIVNGENISFDEERNVSRKYYELKESDVAVEFFKSEHAMMKLMGKIYGILFTECKLEFDLEKF